MGLPPYEKKTFIATPDNKEPIGICPSCAGKEFYTQKDFPRVIAMIIVGLGVVTVPWTLGLSLLVVALIDFVFYKLTPWMCVCYRCRSEFKGFGKNPKHQEFDRHRDELYQIGK